MQKQISDEKRSGIYVLAVDDYLYRVGTLKGNWIFKPFRKLLEANLAFETNSREPTGNSAFKQDLTKY